MRILCLTPWFPTQPNDPHGSYILDSVEALSDQGHDVIVVICKPWRPSVAKFKSNPLSLTFSKKIKYIYLYHYLSIPRSRFLSLSLWFYRKRITKTLTSLAQQHQIQLIHAHTEIAGMAAVSVGKKLHIPSVVTLHGISTESRLYVGKAKQWLYDYGIACANRVILVGKPLFPFLKKLISKDEHIKVVGNGFRLKAEITNKIYNMNHDIQFISVSNLHEGKGIDLNLKALSKLSLAGFNNWTYKIVGDGDQKPLLIQLAKELKISHKVMFLGACPHDEVYSQLSTADVFILPSYREAFGIAYLEAMSLGLLTVGVEEQGAAAFISHERTGLLVAPNNIDSLFLTLKKIYQNKNLIEVIGTQGKEYVYQHCTWPKHAEKLTAIYQELIHGENFV